MGSSTATGAEPMPAPSERNRESCERSDSRGEITEAREP